MIKKIITPLLAVFLSVCTTHAIEGKFNKYKSPDGKYIAYVISSQTQFGLGESTVILKIKTGKKLCSKSYKSKDGQHGYKVEKAAWTSDSQFFVYSTSSSGGHQPWHFPTYFIWVHDPVVQSIDDALGPIMEPAFKLENPDIFITTGLNELTNNSTEIYRTNLNQLIDKKK